MIRATIFTVAQREPTPTLFTILLFYLFTFQETVYFGIRGCPLPTQANHGAKRFGYYRYRARFFC